MSYDLNDPAIRELLDGLEVEPEPAPPPPRFEPRPRWPFPRPSSRGYEPSQEDVYWLCSEYVEPLAPTRRRGKWGS